MKKHMWLLTAVIISAISIAAFAKSEKHTCPLSKEKSEKRYGGICPAEIKGAEVKVINIDTGVNIFITSADTETIKKIQEFSAIHFSKASKAKTAGGSKQQTDSIDSNSSAAPQTGIWERKKVKRE